MVAAIFSNAMWYATMGMILTHDMSWDLFIPYTVGTVAGSMLGVKISMYIEKLLDARSDSHLEGNTCPTK
jgi:membrane protein YqaA with SNARE-associated domain